MAFDILIQGGTVFDGTGEAGRRADVAVRDGRITLPESAQAVDATRVIDAAGRYVLPGFIDIHGHSDFTWLIWPNATSKLLAGFTTDVGGNCGYGAFPLGGEVLARRTADYSKHRLQVDWSDAAGYFDRLESTACPVNRAVQVGHGNLRGVAVGYDARSADAGERARMRRLLADELAAGAFGLSSGLIYPPGCFADADELGELAEVVRDHDGFYSSHIRSEGDGLIESVDEFIDVLKRSGCRGQLSHVKTHGQANWAKISSLHERLTAARSGGVQLQADRYPYLASATDLASMVMPMWAHEGTGEQVLARLADADQRRAIEREVNERLGGTDFFERIHLVAFGRDGFDRFVGKSLIQAGQLLGVEPIAAAIDLLLANAGGVDAVHFAMSEANLAEILSWDFVCIGSDASSRDALSPGDHCHPRTFGSPAAFLSLFVREKGVCDWPTAARKLATMAADMLGLADRGRIAEGCWADLVVLDPERVADRADYEQPRRTPAGIECVLVNGQVAVAEGRFTGATPGRVLRH